MGLFLSYAHPDDESFGAAGLVCSCRERGIPVTLMCATRGDAGKAGDASVSGAPSDVAAAREIELAKATAILGIDDVHLYSYSDRRLAEANVDEIRFRLVTLLRRSRPDVVLTFDPNGFNAHPDHIAISRFTTDALAVAADSRWLPDAGPAHEVRRLIWTAPLGPWDAARAPNLAAKGGIDFVLDISKWRERKAQALKAHKTQHAPVNRYFFDPPDSDRVLSIEVFRHAWGPKLSRRPCADVFDGLLVAGAP